MQIEDNPNLSPNQNALLNPEERPKQLRLPQLPFNDCTPDIVKEREMK